MKALEPVLKFHFWILLGLSLILAIAGWWMTTSQMEAATEDRRKAIKAAVEKVPKDQVPSKDWADKLQAINVDQKALLDRTRDSLYARQRERMVWPEDLQVHLSNLKYRAEIPKAALKEIYRDDYIKEVERVYKIPRPIDPLDKDDPGIVFFPFSALPHKEWGDHTPTSQQMWDSMEDLWLLEPILQAIDETNGGKSTLRHDAIVVAIEYLALKGGDRSKIGQSAEPAGGGMGAGAGAGAMDPGMRSGMGGGDIKGGGDTGGQLGAGGLAGGLGSSGFSISTDIKDVEDLGDPGSTADAGGGMGAAAGSPGMGAGALGDPKAGMMGGGGMANPDAGRRYIDDDPALPYRTRGFKLTVIMDHHKVPDLYTQLTSSERSPWPVQILRMHVARLTDSGQFTPDMSGSGSMGGPDGPPRGAGAFGGAGAGAFGGAPKAGLRGGGGDEDFRPGIGGAGGNPASATDNLANPFLARVTVVGLITLYNEPPPTESAAGTPETPPPTGTDPNALPDTTAAGEPAADGDPEAMSADNVPEDNSLPTVTTDDPEGTDPPAATTDDDPAPKDDQPEKKPASEDDPDTPESSEEKPDEEKPKGEPPAETKPE